MSYVYIKYSLTCENKNISYNISYYYLIIMIVYVIVTRTTIFSFFICFILIFNFLVFSSKFKYDLKCKKKYFILFQIIFFLIIVIIL